MNNLKKMNFTELSSSEMKQVQGGDLSDLLKDLLKIISIEDAAASVGMTVQQVRDLLGL
ncbi:hypothetical protein [Flavobacterium hibernum]|uniref:hypothetical protein n=1 Tax=Flavobacterium hibernum TaxID=37752 RepID=UPI000E04AE54|nr:hypothetical protein [Flavobacterium hibernum]STO15076.1 Uncharacterised protein [Flavobacterium hibernum]